MAQSKHSPTDTVVNKPARKRRGLPKWLWIAAALVLTVGIVAGVAWGFMQLRDNKSAVCTSGENGLATQAAAVLNPDTVNELGDVVKKIQSTKNYESDPNCLFPVVQYYVYVTDQPSAQDSFNKLQAVYSDGVGYDAVYAGKTLTMDQIKAQIDSLTIINDQIKANTKFF
jgi:hypothetical protein